MRSVVCATCFSGALSSVLSHVSGAFAGLQRTQEEATAARRALHPLSDAGAYLTILDDLDDTNAQMYDTKRWCSDLGLSKLTRVQGGAAASGLSPPPRPRKVKRGQKRTARDRRRSRDAQQARQRPRRAMETQMRTHPQHRTDDHLDAVCWAMATRSTT